CCKREKSSCQPGAVHTWHKTDIGARADDVSSLGQSRHCGCERRDLILTRECLRSSPRVGGGRIAGTMRGADRWSWFVRKIFEFFKGKSPRSCLLQNCVRALDMPGYHARLGWRAKVGMTNSD